MDDLLGRVAIYVPTRDRPRAVSDLLDAYARRGFRHHIYIGETSASPAAAKVVQAVVDRFRPLLDVTYLRLAGLGLHVALRRMLSVGSEEFAVFLEDDNFIDPSGLDQSASYLATALDCRAAGGWGVAWNSADPKSKPVCYRSGESLADSPTQRLANFFCRDTFLPYLFVRRRVEFIDDLEAVDTCADVNFLEIAINGLTVIRGKVSRLPIFFLSRPGPRWGEYGIPPALDWLTSATWRDAYLDFERVLTAALTSAGESRDSARGQVRRAFACYMARRFGAPPSRGSLCHALREKWTGRIALTRADLSFFRERTVAL